MRTIPAVFAGLLFLAGCSPTRFVFEPAGSTDPEAKITFVHVDGVRDWQPLNDHQLHAQAADHQWYQVDLTAPCIGLEFASRVRFLPSDPSGDFDRFSSIQMGHQLCKVASVKKVPAPIRVPKSSKTPKPGAAT